MHLPEPTTPPTVKGREGGNPNQRYLFPRGRRDWGDHGRRIEDDRAWQGAADGGMIDRDHKRWQGKAWLSAGVCLVFVEKHLESSSSLLRAGRAFSALPKTTRSCSSLAGRGRGGGTEDIHSSLPRLRTAGVCNSCADALAGICGFWVDWVARERDWSHTSPVLVSSSPRTMLGGAV